MIFLVAKHKIRGTFYYDTHTECFYQIAYTPPIQEQFVPPLLVVIVFLALFVTIYGLGNYFHTWVWLLGEASTVILEILLFNSEKKKGIQVAQNGKKKELRCASVKTLKRLFEICEDGEEGLYYPIGRFKVIFWFLFAGIIYCQLTGNEYAPSWQTIFSLITIIEVEGFLSAFTNKSERKRCTKHVEFLYRMAEKEQLQNMDFEIDFPYC